MRKLIVALFAIGLLFAFTAPAYAYNVDLTGYYRIRGFWFNNESVSTEGTGDNLYRNRAYMDQRLRMQFTVNVAEGLSFTGRFHAMDRWFSGNASRNVVTPAVGTNIDTANNIYWNRVYMTFMTEIGRFQFGYQSGGTWGTVFGDAESDGRARLLYSTKVGDFTILALYEKLAEVDGVRGNLNRNEDMDMDSIALATVYGWGNGNAGLLYYYIRDKRETALAVPFPGAGYDHVIQYLSPYFKATYGDLYVEGQYWYKFGGFDFDVPQAALLGGSTIDYKSNAWYINAKYNINQYYVGMQYAFVEGNDPADLGKNTAGKDGSDYNPTLLLWNDNTTGLGDTVAGWNSTDDDMANASLVQIYAGYAVNPKLDLKVAYTMAWADYTAVGVDDKIGSEFDIEATYKIMDNLEYWIGFGYFWAGDWYLNGTAKTAVNDVDDAWLVMHKIQLNF